MPPSFRSVGLYGSPDDAVATTIVQMSKAAMGRWGAKSPRIRQLAIDIITAAGVDEKDQMGEVRALHNWVRRTIRYVKDPIGQEMVTYPETLAFDIRHGDCDDHSVLLAALLGAVGIPSRFVTVALRPGPFSHVYLAAYVDGRWIPLDPIVKRGGLGEVGWQVPNPARRKAWPVNTDDGPRHVAGMSGLGTLLLSLAGWWASRNIPALGWLRL